MSLPAIWLSAPSVRLPETVFTNEDILGRIREHFRGSDADWVRLERRTLSLLRACGTDRRHLYVDPPPPLAGYAAGAAADALAAQGLSPSAVDMVVYGSIAREYFEPSTAAEVAALLGADHALALDVTAACAGMLLAVQDFVARAAVDDALRVGVACAATVTEGHLGYDIQNIRDVVRLGAGLTLGNASTAFVLSRERMPSSGRIRAMHAEGISEHHGLCRVPVRGPLESDGPAIFALVRHVPGHIRRTCERAGWRTQDVDLFVCHQPSNTVLRELARSLETDSAHLPMIHELYGNCAESAVPVTFAHLLREGKVRPGAKIVLSTAASGFVMATVCVEWEG